MNIIIRYLTHEPQQKNPLIKYGFLAFGLAILIVSVIYSASETRPIGHPFHPTSLPIMIVLNHLASDFTFTNNMRVIVRIMSVLWSVFFAVGFLIIIC